MPEANEQKPCPRCGQVDCDKVPSKIWAQVIEWAESLVKDKTAEPDDGEG